MKRAAALAAAACLAAAPVRAQLPRPAQPPPPAVQDTAPPLPLEIATIIHGQTRAGTLEMGDWTMADQTWADIWYYNATAGQRATIDVGSSQFDPYIQLLDPWGNKLAEDDDDGPGNASRLTYTFREAGRYQIVVNVSGDVARTGRYSLTVR